MAELRRLSTHCKFGAFLDEALRDRLVCGLRSEPIQKKLLTEADLTLTKAIDLSVGMEAADKNAKSLKGPDAAVNRVTPKQKACYRCGRTSHDQSECKFREAECHNCGKRGHIAPVCRSPKKRPTRRNRQTPRNTPRSPANTPAGVQRYVEVTPEREPPEDEEHIPLHSVEHLPLTYLSS